MSTGPGEPQVSQELVGTVIHEKYLLAGLLGHGGMGAVYEARNQATGKKVAVKLLLSRELLGHREFVKRFFREARASAVVESDHVVQIFDSGQDPVTGYPYIVMEVLNGNDLSDVIDQHAPLAPAVVARIILQASSGLARAHEAGVIHRDIKPANLFLCQRENGVLVVKLLDFGIAKIKMENLIETSGNLTRTGSMLGTPLYMSPEQVVNASRIDAKADVWSLGTVMFELLAGRQPFEKAETLGELMLAILNEDLPFVQDKAPWVPADLAAILHRAMARDVSRRYQNGGELRDALAAYVGADTTLREGMIVRVPDADKAVVAPRLVGAQETIQARPLRRSPLASSNITTRSAAMSVTADPPSAASAQPKSRKPVVLIAAGAMVLAAGGLVGWRFMPPHAGAVAADSTVVPAYSNAPAPSVPAADVRTYLLRVRPDDAAATVDGEAATMREGRLAITGSLGKQRLVKIVHAWGTVEKTVTIAETGLVPDELEIAAPGQDAGSSTPVGAGKQTGPRGSGATAATSPPTATTAPPKPTATSTIRTNEEEFH